jgi:hypothetical protein
MGIERNSLVGVSVGHEVSPVSQALERVVEENQRVGLGGGSVRVSDAPKAVIPELGRHGQHVTVKACRPVDYCQEIDNVH